MYCMASVTLKNIQKIYDNGFEAVKHVSVEIQNKEFVVLLGPSGCGKTTTLRMIAGLEDISSGDLHIGEKRVNDVLPKDRDIAMVFQNYALYPHMTVLDNMSFGLKLRKIPKQEIKERVDAAAKILKLEKLLSRKPKQLSGGQRQRVALGRAIVRQPKVFLFDEPLSNLDAKLRAHMRAELADLHRRLDTTMIYVTHDQVEAMTLADKIIIMNDGVILQVGTPLDLYDRPATRFVARFIGSPPMNIFDAQVKVVSGGIELTGLNCRVVVKGPRFEPLRAYDGQSVILGIRPENVKAVSSKNKDNYLEGMVGVVENLGAESYVYLPRGVSEDGEVFFVVKISRSENSIKENNAYVFEFAEDKIHIFDKKTEKSIVGH